MTPSEDPGRVRLAYRRLTRVSGLDVLPEVEARTAELEEAVAEELDLHLGLAEQVAGLEDVLVGLLERRLVERDIAHGPTDVTDE